MDTLKLYGPPGTGKTQSAVNWIVAQVNEGADAEGVAFVSFTRAACSEARTRVELGLRSSGRDIYAWEMPYCATIHALCLRSLHITGRSWLAETRLREFGKTYDYDLMRSSRSDDADEQRTNGQDAPLLAVWEFARHRLISEPDAAYSSYIEYDPEAAYRIPYDRFIRFVEEYEAWKAMAFLRDYTDLLQEAIKQRSRVPASVVAIDEAQDQTPLLWLAADTLFRDCEVRACLADPDQSIYGFQGCAPELFNDRAAEKIVLLDQSYRLPRQVWALARRVILQNRARVDVPFQPLERAGEVRRIRALTEVDLLNGESWMILVRNWAFVNEVASELESSGVPYRVGGDYYSPWDEKGPLRAAKAVYELSEPGGRIGADDLAILLDKTRAGTSTTSGTWRYGKKTTIKDALEDSPARRYGLSDLVSLGLSEWGLKHIALRDLEMLSGISDRDRDAYAAAQRVGTWGQEPRVLLSTIHGVKGGEADNVVMLMASTAAPLLNLDRPDRREEEIRLAYVAITRAKQRFFGLEHQGGFGSPYETCGL